jgi:signal transduction histidine kinase
VALNLLNNAFDAIQSLEEKWIKISFSDIGDWVKIIVTDSGPGIPFDVQMKMMQPFYTTKEIGKGTGLGLSISKGIIERHNGRLYLDNTSPNTQFVIALPKKAAQATETAA